MTKSGYIEANGVNYYYEVHGPAAGDARSAAPSGTGSGERTPLLVLHGGMGNIDMFGLVLPALTANRQVVAVELYGHGRTALGDRKMSLEDMGDDMAVIVRELGYEQIDAFGYSMGGGVAFRFAVQHADLVRRLVLMSAGFSTDGFHPDIRPMQAQMSAAAADMMKDTPMYESYTAVAPRPDDFPKLLDQMGDFMRKDYDWSADVKKLGMPVLLVFGDHDMFTTPHMAEFFNLLGGNPRDAGWEREHMSQNRLAILPDRTHYDMLMAPELEGTVVRFLDI